MRHPMTLRIPMRDGVGLAADLYLPEGAGPFPTLVRKTPYERDRYDDAPYFAAHGYAALIVSLRGRFGSGGEFYQSRNEGWLEHRDGYDTVEWAAAQPWSTGAVGTWGISSDGQWQLATAPTRPPHLKAMFVSYAANHRNGGRLDHGVYASTGPTWHHNNNAFSRPLRTHEDWQDWLAYWKSSGLPLLMSFVHPELIENFVHNAYDGYWREIDPALHFAEFDVPIYHESGWYDRYPRWTLQAFNGVRAHGSALARKSQKVIMGPWIHGGDLPPETDTVKFGPAARIDRLALHLRWFDHWLMGIDTGIMDEPPVRLWLMGAEGWVESESWPLPGTEYVTYYLRGGRSSSAESLNDGRLGLDPPGSEEPDAYVHDPYDPIPAIGGHGGYPARLELRHTAWQAGPQDQRPAEARCLTFTTDPLPENLDVVGELPVRFFASSSAVDTDFVLTLSDVYPNGYSAILRQNAIRARYRLSEETESLLVPNEVYEFELTLDGIANVFKAGHRIRLRISSSSFPAFIPNPGTAGPLFLETRAVTARNAIYHDAARASSIRIPVRR